LCADAGGQGDALPRLGAAVVDGAILGLSALVVWSAVLALVLEGPDRDGRGEIDIDG
jgi:hypothetical protein